MPTGSSYQVCICANCTGSSPQDVSFNFGPVGGGPCENQYPNACATLEGFYVLHWVYRQNNCEWIGYADSNPCSYAEFVLQLLSDRLRLFLVSGDAIDPTWEKLIPDWGEFDCSASHTLTMVSSSAFCSLPSTVTISPVAPSLSSMGDWECATEICPCEPTPVPSSGAKWCCYPKADPAAPGSPYCPCECELGPPTIIGGPCECSGLFCVRAWGGCDCPPTLCCKGSSGGGCSGGDCGCSEGGSCGCSGGGCGGGGGEGEATRAFVKPPSGGQIIGCATSANFPLDQIALALKEVQSWRRIAVPGREPALGLMLNLRSGGLWVKLGAPYLNPFDPPVVLTYNSRSTQNAEFGYGWAGRYKANISELSNANVILVYGSGSQWRYVAKDGSGKYIAPGPTRDALVKNGNGTWTQTTPEGLKYQFDSTGKLVRIDNAVGNRWTLSHDGGGRVLKILDPFSRRTSFL